MRWSPRATSKRLDMIEGALGVLDRRLDEIKDLLDHQTPGGMAVAVAEARDARVAADQAQAGVQTLAVHLSGHVSDAGALAAEVTQIAGQVGQVHQLITEAAAQPANPAAQAAQPKAAAPKRGQAGAQK